MKTKSKSSNDSSFTAALALVLCLNFLLAFYANAIEGGSPTVLKENSKMFEAVFALPKINLKPNELNLECTATLIEKNILLTDKHCTEQMVPGTILNLMSQTTQDSVKIIKVISGTKKLDLSLVLFESQKCDQSFVESVAPLPVALNSAGEPKLIRNESGVLIAGYGLHSPYDADKILMLSAGKNDWSINDFGTALPNVNASDLKFLYSNDLEGERSEMLIQAKRIETTYLAQTLGQALNLNLSFTYVESQPNQAVPLSGDSGSPAIQMGYDGQYYLVAVAKSGVLSLSTTELVKYTLSSGANFKDFSVCTSNQPKVEIGVCREGARAKMDAWLSALNLESSTDHVITQPVGLVKVAPVLHAGNYTPLISPENANFIHHALMQLDMKRATLHLCR
jgi:hypothetical protein